MEEHIPAINADGCTCGDSDHFVSFHTVREPEGRLLGEYQMLIYKRNRQERPESVVVSRLEMSMLLSEGL